MTAKEYNIILIELGLTPRLLSRLLGVSERTVYYWKVNGLDEGAGGAQAAVARTLRLLRSIPTQEEVMETIRTTLQEEVTAS